MMKNIRLFVFLCLGFGLVLSPALQISAKAPATAKIAFASNRSGQLGHLYYEPGWESARAVNAK